MQRMQRRTFLGITGMSMIAPEPLGSYPTPGGAQPAADATFWTPLCDLLGIEFPIVQSGMGRVAGPELAAEVSNAGGLGILAGLGLPPEELRRQIHTVRELTSRPFGVNQWLHTELRPPVAAESIPEERIRAVQTVLNRFRERLGIPASLSRPAGFPDTIDPAFEVILAERVPVWSTACGDPEPDRVRRCHERGIRVMAMVATVDDARRVAASGADIIVAQGGEAGGHRSTGTKPASREKASVGTMTLVPQIVDAVDVPVVAAGGIADGRGLVASLALGAVGILMGTRFVATRESMAPEMWKKAILEGSSDGTTVTDSLTGLYARTIRNTFVEEYEASGAPVLPGLLHAQAAQDIYGAAVQQGEREYFPLMAGQSVGLIRNVPGAGEVVATVLREAREAADALRGLLGG